MRTLSYSTVQRFATTALIALVVLLFGVGNVNGQSISFIQANSAVPQSPQTAVSVTFTAAQTAGDLDVVVAGWNDSTAHVLTVVDSKGNTYLPAVGPTVLSGFGSQAIYYAKNIQASQAGGNSVTVTFDQPANYVDLRIAEYRGLDLNNPVDVISAATGSTTSSNSGSIATSNPNDLLVGANLVASLTTGPGTGYTSRLITNPDSDILEDRVVSAVGSYNALAPVSGGSWIMQMVAFRAASSSTDTQAPTAPSSLITTAISSTQINLSWTGSTDNVGVTNYLMERCQGSGCSTFAQVGTSTSLTFNNTGLTAATSYSYRVRATDAAGNLSGYSNTSTVSTPSAPDTQAPTAPGGLITTAISSTQINLSWTGSTDNIGVTNYLVERCQGSGCTTFAQVGTSTSLTFNNTGLTATTSYSYRVRATDAAGNLSSYSNTSTASTPSVPDTQAPTAPSNLITTAISSTQINLGWTASADNVGVTNYLVERCQGPGCTTYAQVGTSTGLTFNNTGLTAATSYSYQVRATDAAGNLSGYSNISTISTPTAPDTQAPTAPSGLITTAISSTQINLSWTGSTDNVGVSNYLVERCQGSGCTTFAQVGTSTGLTFNNTGLTAATSYSYRVRATDAAANLSGYSNTSTTSTPSVPDTQPPTAPGNLITTAISSTQINLSWTGSTDNVGVTNYLVERCQGSGCTTFAQVGTSASLTFNNTGLTAGTSYSYRVRATDAAGNLSGYSNTSTMSTPTPDTQAPTAPSSLITTVISSGQVNLIWVGSTDNVGVTNYLVERCQGAGCGTFAQVGTSTSLTFNDSGLTAGTSYSYRVRATDAAGNLSAYTPVSTATTQGTPLISYIQSNSAAPQSAQSTVTVPYTLAQSLGNLNVVVVGWNSSSNQVQSVTDARGNLYVLAVGPTVFSGFATQSIYYAANILPSSAGNVVTVVFNGPVPYADIRIAEYAGITSVNPVDVVAAAQGNGTLGNSGAVTTTNPADLIVGANIVSSNTTGPGTSFTSRVISVPDADILEDRVVTAAGSYSATAPMTSGSWIMQMVAFKSGTFAPDTQAPSAVTGLVASVISGTQINLSWTASTDNVGVTGYKVERCQGAGCIGFAEVSTTAGSTTVFNDTTVSPNTTFVYRIRATDAAGNLGAYSNSVTASTPSPDTESPSAPGLLVATAVSGTQIDISWGPATDNVGVAGYRLERCQDVGCSAFTKFGTTLTGTTFSDIGLNLNTSYSYIIRAQDAAGNLGPYSNVATAVTLSINPQLVAAYTFEEGAGTTVNDFSGHGNTGTIANATWSANGKFGKALSFNGTNAVVTIPDSASLHLTTGMTLEAWVNKSSVNLGWRDVIYKGDDNYYLEGSTTNGQPGIGIKVGATQAEAIGLDTLVVNDWTFLAATYDGSTLRFYVNGTQVSSQPKTGSITTSTNPLQIGGDSLYGQYFPGLIDEVRIYNVALTPGQIQSDMVTALGSSSPVFIAGASMLSFPSQSVGTSSIPQALTVTNGGAATLAITGITISGAQGADFSQTNNCVGSLAPSGTCAINVTFTPGGGGTRNGTILVADNAPGSPHAIALTGTGVGFSISPQTYVLIPPRTEQFTVSGAGTSSVQWSVDSIVGGTSATGTITSSGLYTSPNAAGMHTITVATTDGAKSATGTVYVTTNAGVFTHHNDNARSGLNPSETVLNPSNVNSNTFGKLAAFSTDGISHASPLYVANVNIPGIGLRNVVYVATEHDSLYAFDADGTSTTPLWHVSFINQAAGITTVPNGDTGECCDITPEIGITGTPVIDPTTGTLYVVVKTKESASSYPQRLHALDIATGAEKLGGPVLIQATVPGTGVGSSGGQLAFNSLRENARTAMLLYNGVLYFGFGSHGDYEPYHGWLLGYNATTLQRVLAFCTTPNGEGGGIWQSGGGLVVDSSGNIFFATGDGTFDASSGGTDYGDSFIRFNTSTGVMDYFTPHDENNLNSSNLDLNAGGMILLPDQTGLHPHLLVSAGKNGSVYLVDRDNMTHFHTTDQNPQTLANVFPFGTPLPGNYSSPVYFNGSVYFGPVADVVQEFTLTNGLLSTFPTSTTPQIFAYPGAALSVSANGTSNGIIWAIQKSGSSSGALHAYSAGNLTNELYNSNQAGSRDTLDAAAKFSLPLVINGKVYVVSEGQMTIYGLLP